MELAERVVRGRQAITLAKHRGMDTAVWERHLEKLLAKAGLEPTLEEGVEPQDRIGGQQNTLAGCCGRCCWTQATRSQIYERR